MLINFSPLRYAQTNPAPAKSVLGQTQNKPQPLAFKGYYNDVTKFNHHTSDFFEYSLEHVNPDEKPRTGAIMYKPGIIFNRNTTSSFRSDLNWIEFGDYLEDRFEYDSKVNTYDYACANGLEAYTLSLLLQRKFPDCYEKFFPIQAKDVNPDEIISNKKGQEKGFVKTENTYVWTRYGLGIEDDELDEYLAVSEDEIPENDVEYFTKKVISPVEFSCANVLDDIENIDTTAPALFLCRNMWPYVKPSEYQSFCDKLYEKLPAGSVVVIGAYEYKGQKGFKGSKDFPDALIKSGFEPAECCYHDGLSPLVFEKN